MWPGQGVGLGRGEGPHLEKWKYLVGVLPQNWDWTIHQVRSEWEGVRLRVLQLAVNVKISLFF